MKTKKRYLIVSIFCTTLITGVQNAWAIGELVSGGFSAPVIAKLTWTHDPNTVTSSYLNSYISPGINQWNLITPKVASSYVGSGSYSVKVYVSTASSRGQFGECVPYCASGTGQGVDCHPDRNWFSAKVIGYERNMYVAGYTTTNRIKTYAHEFGHALSLNEVTASVNAVMKQGKFDYGVQAYDVSNLKFKWE
jgi:hypothetical protein